MKISIFLFFPFIVISNQARFEWGGGGGAQQLLFIKTFAKFQKLGNTQHTWDIYLALGLGLVSC